MKPRILVVEDELLLRQMMRETLEALPAAVIEAKDGEEALQLAPAEQLNLIICDVMMPGLSGFDVAEALKDDPRTAEIPRGVSARPRLIPSKVPQMGQNAP